MDAEPEQIRSSESGSFTFHRRTFLASTLVLGTAASVGIASHPVAAEAIAEKLDRKDLASRLRDESLTNRKQALLTAIESVVVFAGNVTMGSVVERFGIEHGGHAGDGDLFAEQELTQPLRMYIQTNFVLPVLEEALFRLLPSALFAERSATGVQLAWKTGLVTTALFGAVHNVSKPDPNHITIHLNSLPLEQLILGGYCWYAQRSGGFGHAVGAHILYNNLCQAYERYVEQPECDQ